LGALGGPATRLPSVAAECYYFPLGVTLGCAGCSQPRALSATKLRDEVVLLKHETQTKTISEWPSLYSAMVCPLGGVLADDAKSGTRPLISTL
ncbi:hypothetical protein COCMIDRAFT_57155, partial [Bipolaris oryzae ATCC 44560]